MDTGSIMGIHHTVTRLTSPLHCLAASIASGADVNTLVKYGALSADLGSEEAIDVVLHNTYPDPDGLWKGYKRLKFVPFNPNDKFTMAVVEDEKTGQVFRLMKGAPQVSVVRPWPCVVHPESTLQEN